MNRKLFTAGLGAMVVLGLGLSAADVSATVIGDPSQSSKQGVNATQQANAPSATGAVVVVDPGPPGPVPVQSSTNVLSSDQAVGPAGGETAIISPDGKGPTQSSQQGVNGQQVSAGGAIGEQDSANVLSSTQIVGGDTSCIIVPVGCEASVIIGSPIQDSQQGVNGSQSADGGVTTGISLTTPELIFNGLAGPTSQFSLNDVSNSQVVLG